MKTFLSNSFYRVDVQYQLRASEAASSEKSADIDRRSRLNVLRLEGQFAHGDGVHFAFDFTHQPCFQLFRCMLQGQTQQRYACRRVAQRFLVDQRALYDQ